MLDSSGGCTLVVRDMEGSLYSTWSGYNFIKMAITNGTGTDVDFDNENCIFRGYLVKKQFTTDAMILYLRGLAAPLEWKPFNNNYILEEGLVKTVPLAGTTDSVELKYIDANGDEQDFAWAADYWVSEQDTGVLIVDNTQNISYETWICTANPTTANGTEISGDKDSLDDPNDDDTYYFKDASGIWDVVATIPMGADADADEIDDSQTLHKIEIDYRFGMRTDEHSLPWTQDARFRLQISKDGGTWEDVFDWKTAGQIVGWSWIEGTWVKEDTNTNLALYLDDDDADNKWDSLEGLRFAVTGGTVGKGVYIQLDYISVRVYYESYDIVPIMKRIIGSSTTSVQCANTTWTETGVAADDSFKIGQNTRQIIADISTQSGVDIYIQGEDLLEDQTITLRPAGDDTTEWTDVATPHWNKIDEETPDGTAIQASDDDDDLIEIYDMETADLGLDAIITAATVYIYCKETPYTDPYFIDVYLSWDEGASWSAKKTVSPTGSYALLNTGAWSGLTYGQVDLNQLQVKIDASDVAPGHTKYVDQLYITLTYDYVDTPLTKYMARIFKGCYCEEAFNSLCKLEGVHWFEDYENNRIIVSLTDDFEDSTVDLTQADYDHDWQYEDSCNHYYKVELYGYPVISGGGIYAYAEDTSVDSPMVKTLIDETVPTNSDAQEIVDTQLAELKVKRPSIKLSLNGVQANLSAGKTVGITMARPTVAEADYPIRMIEREDRGVDGFKTTVYAGLGKTEADEHIGRTIKNIGGMAHKAQTDRLVNVYTDSFTTGAITWADVGGADAAVAAAIAILNGYVETALAIGASNKRWINCILSGAVDYSDISIYQAVRNVGADDINVTYDIPLPHQITWEGSTYNLVITDVKIGIAAGDADDYVTKMWFFGWTDEDSVSTILSDETDVGDGGAEEYTYGHADTTVGGVYEKIMYYFNCVNTDQYGLKISYVQAQYYYASA